MNYKHQGLPGLAHYCENEICQVIYGPQNGKNVVLISIFLKIILNPGLEDMPVQVTFAQYVSKTWE